MYSVHIMLTETAKIEKLILILYLLGFRKRFLKQ